MKVGGGQTPVFPLPFSFWPRSACASPACRKLPFLCRGSGAVSPRVMVSSGAKIQIHICEDSAAKRFWWL